MMWFIGLTFVLLLIKAFAGKVIKLDIAPLVKGFKLAGILDFVLKVIATFILMEVLRIMVSGNMF